MHLKQNRLAATLAATAAVLALGAAPALAGENDDGDDEDQAAPAPITSSSSSGDEAGTTISGAPQGGVATGAGGTAPQGPDEILLALASGALVLVATGGGVLTVARRTQS